MRTPLALALGSLSLFACSSPSKPAPKAAEPAPDPGAEQPTTPVEPAAQLDPEAVRQQRVAAALARVPDLKLKLEELRALKFKTDVPSAYQTADDFRAFVNAEIAAELAPEKSKVMSAAYFHMGLLATEVDLGTTFADAMTSQAAAYYDPKQEKFFVVMVPKDDISLDTISVHELTHALQDQHFDLEAFMLPGGKPLDDDASNARKFLVEGEATLTMMVYATELMTGGKKALSPEMLPVIKPGLQQAAKLSVDDFKAMTKAQAEGADGMDEEIKKSLEAMDSIPPLILVPMVDSYMKGALVAFAAYEAGGWDEVGKLYATPPDSTEQVLHPDTKLYPKRDVPKTVTLPALKGYTTVFENTMGELTLRVFFGLWNKPVAETAPAGWDGDRWAVLTGKDGASVGVFVSTWDDKAEAAEFVEAYKAAFAARFPDGARKMWIEAKGANVYVVDGGTDAKLIKTLVKSAKIGK